MIGKTKMRAFVSPSRNCTKPASETSKNADTEPSTEMPNPLDSAGNIVWIKCSSFGTTVSSHSAELTAVLFICFRVFAKKTGRKRKLIEDRMTR